METSAETSIDWRALMDDAFDAILVGALRLLRETVEAPQEPIRTATAVIVDDDAARAAALLGVSTAASADEIRAALRARMTASRLHPDQGGDGEEAAKLIAAKNLLIERLTP